MLVVDDEKDFLTTIIKRLNSRGLTVAGATKGRQALALMEEDFDVVILDVKIPGMEGIETLQEMKKKKVIKEVIMLTGHASGESGIQGTQLGGFDIVIRPVPWDKLRPSCRRDLRCPRLRC